MGARRASPPPLVLVAAVLAAVVVAACSRSQSGTVPPDQARSELVVASFDFDESVLLAEIYAQAVEDVGVPVRREQRLGSRELVLPALQQGLVDLVPEYLGSALAAIAPEDEVVSGDADAVRRALHRAGRRWGLQPTTPAAAQNHNAFVVTRAFAYQHGLTELSDLRPIAVTATIGGPPECPERPFCVPGLRATYGLEFGRFFPVEGATQVAQALDEALIDVGVMFSTDGLLADQDLVVLVDDRDLNPAEHVVPLVRSDVLERWPRLRPAVDEVSSRLTTSMLRFLNWRVTVAGNDPAAEARGWLIRQGIVER
jgi:osmoprotectant transport system substrate-binding protein